MINFSLLNVSGSSISPKSLWDKALPAVIEVLTDCGYTVFADDTVEIIGDHKYRRQYRLGPDPATLTASFSRADGGKVEFVLAGDRFGMALVPGQNDPLLWMRLVVLGVRLAETFSVVPSVCDPAFAGGTGLTPEQPDDAEQPLPLATPSPDTV
jgi:hypothetical protein